MVDTNIVFLQNSFSSGSSLALKATFHVPIVISHFHTKGLRHFMCIVVILSVAGGGRRWRAKPMVTPVHRFQPVECVAGHPHMRRPNRHGCSSQPAYRLPFSDLLDIMLKIYSELCILDKLMFILNLSSRENLVM